MFKKKMNHTLLLLLMTALLVPFSVYAKAPKCLKIYELHIDKYLEVVAALRDLKEAKGSIPAADALMAKAEEQRIVVKEILAKIRIKGDSNAPHLSAPTCQKDLALLGAAEGELYKTSTALAALKLNEVLSPEEKQKRDFEKLAMRLIFDYNQKPGGKECHSCVSWRSFYKHDLRVTPGKGAFRSGAKITLPSLEEDMISQLSQPGIPLDSIQPIEKREAYIYYQTIISHNLAVDKYKDWVEKERLYVNLDKLILDSPHKYTDIMDDEKSKEYQNSQEYKEYQVLRAEYEEASSAVYEADQAFAEQLRELSTL